MIYEVMDVRKMSYPDRHFDMVLDKSTIDALCCSEAPIIDVAMMLKEVYRVLRPGGIFALVDFHRPTNPLFWPSLALLDGAMQLRATLNRKPKR